MIHAHGNIRRPIIFGCLSISRPRYAYRLLRQDEKLGQPLISSDYKSLYPRVEDDVDAYAVKQYLRCGTGLNVLSASLSIEGLNKFIQKHHEKNIRVVKLDLAILDRNCIDPLDFVNGKESIDLVKEHNEVFIVPPVSPAAYVLEYDGPKIMLPTQQVLPGG